MNSPKSRHFQAPTVDRNKQDSCYRWRRRACRFHTWTHLFSGNRDKRRGEMYPASDEDRIFPENINEIFTGYTKEFHKILP